MNRTLIFDFIHSTDGKRANTALLMRHGGFTLIELLVVVLIIGILAAVALPQYRRVVGKARLAEGLQMGPRIQQAQQLYKLENGEYADRYDKLVLSVPCPAETPTTTGDGEAAWSCHPNTTHGFSPKYSQYKYAVYKVAQDENVILIFPFDNTQHNQCVAWPGDTSNTANYLCRSLTGKSNKDTTTGSGAYSYYF